MRWNEFITQFWEELLVVYCVTQVVVPVAARGAFKFIALIPLPLMLFAGWTAFNAYQQKSNLWALPLVIGTPLALAYLLLVALVMIVVAIFHAKLSGAATRT
jgi:hypothetical protein